MSNPLPDSEIDKIIAHLDEKLERPRRSNALATAILIAPAAILSVYFMPHIWRAISKLAAALSPFFGV